MDEPLPEKRQDFDKLLGMYFPNSYDIKSFQHLLYSMFSAGGLNKLADFFGVERTGTTHQAGSDSLVTIQVFFKLKNSSHNFEKIVESTNR